MSLKSKLVHGIGVNDADYPVTAKKIFGDQGKRVICPIYLTWSNMIQRCYSAKYQERAANYAGCEVDSEWHYFSAFRAWMLTQDWEGNHLDKDILFRGNRTYSQDRCVFVPGGLNKFLTDHGAARGKWPIGVSWHTDSGKLMARCRNPIIGKDEHLGFFTSPEDAHEAWRARKHELACTYADQQTDPRIAKALRTRYINQEQQQ